eukprot:scaffold834_cov130-Isochrysis_galbana.AAC.1
MVSCIDGHYAICIRHAPRAVDGEQRDSDAGDPSSQQDLSSQQVARQVQRGGSGELPECATSGAVPALGTGGAARRLGTEPATDAPQGKAAEAAGDLPKLPRLVFEPSRLHFTPYHLRPEVKKSAGR